MKSHSRNQEGMCGRSCSRTPPCPMLVRNSLVSYPWKQMFHCCGKTCWSSFRKRLRAPECRSSCLLFSVQRQYPLNDLHVCPCEAPGSRCHDMTCMNRLSYSSCGRDNIPAALDIQNASHGFPLVADTMLRHISGNWNNSGCCYYPREVLFCTSGASQAVTTELCCGSKH